MIVQEERALQQEIMLRLARAPIVCIPVPNSVYYPTRSPAEKAMVARLVHQLKSHGAILPGAPDLVFLGAGGRGGAIELKRPSSKTLFGKKAKGSLSTIQRQMREELLANGANYAVCSSWPEVRYKLIEWGLLPEGFGMV